MSNTVCAKCHRLRRTPDTDKSVETLTKYKTCDSCRRRNKLYKKNQKEKLNSRHDTILQSVPLSVMDSIDYELTKNTLFSEQSPEDMRDTFNGFLEGVSKNSSRDVNRLKYKGTIPGYVIQPLEDNNPLLPLFLHPNNVDEDMGAVGAMKEIFKKGLRIHYLARVQDILERMGYRFTGRSTKWKGTRFYAQLTCTKDMTNVKEQTAQKCYDCGSSLKLSYDAYSGALAFEFSHRRHIHSVAKGLQGTGPETQTPEELIETPLLGSFASKLNALHNGEWGT